MIHDDIEKYFSMGKWIYMIGAISITVLMVWQYQEENYIASISQAFCLGSLLTSWLFAYFNDKRLKASIAQQKKWLKENGIVEK